MLPAWLARRQARRAEVVLKGDPIYIRNHSTSLAPPTNSSLQFHELQQEIKESRLFLPIVAFPSENKKARITRRAAKRKSLPKAGALSATSSLKASPKPAALAVASKAPHHHPSRPTLTLRHSFEIHATMADPSASVSPQLLHHLHALCVMKYPLYQSLQPELLVDMLLKAPVVVQQYPFAWSMIEPPPPGSLMLSWHPPAMGTSCASDGYVWADPENVHTVDVKGYVCSPPILPWDHVISYVSTLSRCITSRVFFFASPYYNSR